MQISFMQELYRKIVHLSSLIYPILYLTTNREITFFTLFFLFIIVFLWDILRILNVNINILGFINNILRHEEKSQKRFSGATWFLFSCWLLVFLFPKYIAIISMLVLIVSDTVAALIGRKYGKIHMLGKTLEGSFAFFISSLIIILFCSFIFSLNYDYSRIFIVVICGTIAELLSKKIHMDDNFLITMVVAIILNI